MHLARLFLWTFCAEYVFVFSLNRANVPLVVQFLSAQIVLIEFNGPRSEMVACVNIWIIFPRVVFSKTSFILVVPLIVVFVVVVKVTCKPEHHWHIAAKLV